MVLLVMAVVVLAALVAVDLVLSAAIIRRLRETEERLDDVVPQAPNGMAPGEQLPEFATEDGAISRSDLAGRPALVGFFSGGCRYCPRQAELLHLHAAELAAQGVTVLSVLTLADEADGELAPILRKSGIVAVEAAPGTTMPTFGEAATPTFLRFDEAGVLVARGNDVREVLDAR